MSCGGLLFVALDVTTVGCVYYLHWLDLTCCRPLAMRYDSEAKTELHPQEQKSAQYRRASHDSITVEELPDGEMAYDGDTETVRPDEIEEPQSDPEEVKSPDEPRYDYETWQNRLAEKLKELDCNSDDALSRPPSRKRRPQDQVESDWADGSLANSSGGPEITEVLDESGDGPDAKRLRRKVRRTRTAEKIVHKLPMIQTDLGEVRESTGAQIGSSDSSVNTPSSLPTPADDAMDVD